MKQSSLHYDFLLLNPSVGEEDISCLHPLRTQSDFLTGMLSQSRHAGNKFFLGDIDFKKPAAQYFPGGRRMTFLQLVELLDASLSRAPAHSGEIMASTSQ